MNTSCRPLRFSRALFALPMLALIGAHSAHAVCVSTTAQLYAKLAESEQQPDNVPYTIKLVQGFYGFGGYRDNPTSQFTLAGGYTDSSCTTRVINPDNTVIDFNGDGFLSIYQSTASPIGSVTIEGITFRNGEGVAFDSGKYNHVGADDPGNVVLRNVRFTNLTSNANGQNSVEYMPVELGSRKGSVSVINTVFDHLHQSLASTTCQAQISLDDAASVLMMFDSIETSGGQSFCINPDADGDTNIVQLFNSIIWSSDGLYGQYQPLHLGDGPDSAPLDVSLYSNTISGYDGPSTVQDFFTRSANPQDRPQWINPVAGAGGNYGLLPTSTAINSGFPVAIVGYPAIDIASNPRLVGATVDRGAVESPYVDTPSTVVTNTNDSGAGSLRAAMITANQFDNPDTITFSLPGCPSIIQLNSPLPIIHAPLTIDGYAGNPLAIPNGAANAFNASLCVVIEEANPGTILNGLAVDTTNGGLTLRGLAFGGFYNQVSIGGGSDHYISGNQFGGSVGGVNLAGANYNAVLVHGVQTGTVTIGGPTPGERNDIVQASKNGVMMDDTVTTGNCHIDNNLIGLMPDGVGERGNEYGIQLQNNHCSITRNRIAANLIDGIWINGGRFNTVQNNVFGLNGQGNSTLSYGWAVLIDGSNNNIGASQTVGYQPGLGNAISFMGDGGVHVNGVNNSVRANLIGFNGYAHDGSSPDIQLAAGANFGQPFAVVDSLNPPSPPLGTPQPATVKGHLDSGANSNYKIDVYYSETCAPNGRGHAEYYLGAAQVTTNANGHATFSVRVTLPVSAATSVLSLAATDDYANSSEIGTCFPVNANASDTIFANGFNP